ncbi:hypothetical protein HZB94_04120 [Candidatus Falkowbacteria bacterium]|nr:hypothetical protein [Candidatus Falkowbacteria bacterium]
MRQKPLFKKKQNGEKKDTIKKKSRNEIKDRLAEFLKQSDEWWNTHPAERAEMDKERLALEEENKGINVWRQTLRETLAERKEAEAEIVSRGERERRRKELEEKRARGELISSFTEITREGKEIAFDLEQIRQESREFYQAHNLEEFANALSEEIRLSPESEARLRKAMQNGFDRAIFLPGIELQRQNQDALIQELAANPRPGLPNQEQYTAPYINEVVKTERETKNRPQGKGYLLLYNSGSIPGSTKGKTFVSAKEKLDKLFGKGNWDGLTLEEYLVLQRQELEERGNHSFDSYSDVGAESQWTWLLDSRVSSGCVGARWSPGRRRVDVGWFGSVDSGSSLGARPAVVVPIL